MEKTFDSNKDYHSSSNISASGLKTIYSQSVSYFLNQKYNETEAMKFGTAVHTLILEGRNEFKKNYYFMPKLDLRKKANKEIRDQHLKIAKNKILLDSEVGRNLFTIVKNLEQDKLALYYCNGIVEQSHYGTFEGVKIRVRPDCHSDTWISDVKTCRDISLKSFRSEVRNRNYDLQATFYCDALGYDPRKFRFVAIRNQYPFDVAVYALNDDQIEAGRYKYLHALRLWKHYKETGVALGVYSDNKNEDGSIVL